MTSNASEQIPVF